MRPLIAATVRLSCTLLVLSTGVLPVSATADEVRVAVASNFALPAKTLAEAFALATGHRATISTGSTGKFYAQIRNGAPFDVLLAADAETPARLVDDQLALAGSQMTYAIGRLALWSRQPGRVDAQGQILGQGGFRNLAIANPRLAPYGVAAREVLSGLGLLPALEPLLVQGENIAQTHQFVASGSAELGFVALSQVLVDGAIRDGSAWIVPAERHRPIRQDAVILAAAAENRAAFALVSFLRTEQARQIIRAHGYDLDP